MKSCKAAARGATSIWRLGLIARRTTRPSLETDNAARLLGCALPLLTGFESAAPSGDRHQIATFHLAAREYLHGYLPGPLARHASAELTLRAAFAMDAPSVPRDELNRIRPRNRCAIYHGAAKHPSRITSYEARELRRKMADEVVASIEIHVDRYRRAGCQARLVARPSECQRGGIGL